MNRPYEISEKEWREILSVRAIRDAWGLDDNATVKELQEMVYGVRFDFASLGPGYCGDLYLLCGDVIAEPFTLVRTKRGLHVVQRAQSHADPGGDSMGIVRS